MESIFLTKEELGSLKELFKHEPAGVEGNIYLYEDDKVLKIFKSKDPNILKNKYNKIHLLNKLNQNNITLPEKLVYIDGEFAGYSMKYYSDSETLYEKSFKSRKSELIHYLKLLKNIVLDLHSKNICLIDFNSCNFLIDNGNIMLCDCDNWCINEFKPDVLNVNTNELLNRGIELGPIMDIYNFNLMTVCVLKRIFMSYIIHYITNNRAFYNKEAEEIIDNMLDKNKIETRFIIDSFKEKRLNLF